MSADAGTRGLRVLLVDDHEGMRSVIRTALARQSHLLVEIIGEAENGHEAVEAAARHLPEVVIMDVEMPCQDGVEATRQIAQRFPAIRVIGWTMCDEATIEDMKAAGAAIVLRKDAGLVMLFEALLGIANALGGTQTTPGAESA